MFVYCRDVPFEEKMLWASVLRRAVFDYVLYRGVRQHSLEWKRAFQYVFTPNQKYDNGFSFDEVCELFGWDPDYLRRKVTTLTRADVKKIETSQVREEFVFDIITSAAEQTERWKTENFAAPFLPLYKYALSYRDQMKPRVVRRETFLCMIPRVQWQATA
jgi:hypothetical protein